MTAKIKIRVNLFGYGDMFDFGADCTTKLIRIIIRLCIPILCLDDELNLSPNDYYFININISMISKMKCLQSLFASRFSTKKIEIFINDKPYQVENNLSIYQAAKENGIEIPRFCYHERLKVAGNCRMCLVEV
jgi:hypothetical protein